MAGYIAIMMIITIHALADVVKDTKRKPDERSAAMVLMTVITIIGIITMGVNVNG